MILSLAAAVGAALAYGVSTVLQAVAARRAAGLGVVRQPLAVLGLLLDGTGFLLSLLALDRLPLFVVQAVQGSSVVVVVLLAPVALGARLRGRDGVAVVVVVGALAVLAGAAGEQPAVRPPDGFTTVMLGATVVLAAALAVAYRRGGAWTLATLAGLGYSGAAVAARAAHASGDLLDAVLQPLALVVLGCGAVGVLGYLRALERGAVGPVAALLSVVEVLVPGVVGVAVLGDVVRAGWAWAAVLAVLAAVAGCVLLATSPANAAAEAPEPAAPPPGG
ncbi:hypothetical protein [Cellulomonas shaoxiangyii]|uniref:Integral membrane protein n=1 Tax=Cellulomonas shaoxiangyii TaxID=2566013 RepID=A0A4P7SHR6_9CELL|nr:hypothetical protein [Cellulomonas shaoxiangyii]QCB93540.1 hypothetical protein E5225_08165 [Cellulomonas shaoxiangyii]TGY86862.1 hypothetical protein E5226_00485 [Cellulomonas shaoxiangyii]